MRVQVYRNLHTGGWSIRRGGRVIAHVDACALRDVVFHVGYAEQKRIAAGKARSVHAWATGELAESAAIGREWVHVTYRPRECSFFYRRDNWGRVDGAELALFGSDGRMMVCGPR